MLLEVDNLKKYFEIKSGTIKEEKQILKADTVITASPLSPNIKFFTAMEGMVPEIFPIGDCNEPGLIKDAIAAGARIAYTI